MLPSTVPFTTSPLVRLPRRGAERSSSSSSTVHEGRDTLMRGQMTCQLCPPIFWLTSKRITRSCLTYLTLTCARPLSSLHRIDADDLCRRKPRAHIYSIYLFCCPLNFVASPVSVFLNHIDLTDICYHSLSPSIDTTCCVSRPCLDNRSDMTIISRIDANTRIVGRDVWSSFLRRPGPAVSRQRRNDMHGQLSNEKYYGRSSDFR